MKQTLLLIIGITCFTISSIAQSNWEPIYKSSDVLIEMKTEDCNPNNRLVPNTFALLKYTNNTNQDITFDFEMFLWYNDVLKSNTPKDAGDPAAIKSIQLYANSSLEGNCNSKEEYLKIFYKHNHPKIKNELTRIEFELK